MPEINSSLPSAALEVQSRFQVWHSAAMQSAAHLKIAKYLCGLEVAALAAALDAAPGRKKDAAAVPFETACEEVFGVTARTARRYRVFFEAVQRDCMPLAEALNGLWRTWTQSKRPALPNGAECGALATAKLTAADLESLCRVADEMGLCELFEAPAKDVADVAEDDGARKNRTEARQRMLRFWVRDVSAALQRREYLRLPKEAREALAHELETAAKELKKLNAAKK